MDGKTRLQKACDACNIRKVKVRQKSQIRLNHNIEKKTHRQNLIIHAYSVTSADLHASHVSLWISRVLTTVPRNVGVHQIKTQKHSRRSSKKPKITRLRKHLKEWPLLLLPRPPVASYPSMRAWNRACRANQYVLYRRCNY